MKPILTLVIATVAVFTLQSELLAHDSKSIPSIHWSIMTTDTGAEANSLGISREPDSLFIFSAMLLRMAN